MLVRDVAEGSQRRDEYGLESVYVEPFFASAGVSDEDEVNWPFGRCKKIGVDGCFWGAVYRGKAHLGGSHGGKDFHMFMRKDVG